MAKKAPESLAERQKPALAAETYHDLLRRMLTVYYLEERLKVFVRAGKVSMLDLEALSRELKDRCVTVEGEWLAPNRKPR